jgi:hypothetical protein
MGRIVKHLEGTCRGVIEEKCRPLAVDTKEGQDSRLRNHDKKREPPEFILEALVLGPHSSVSLFGGGGGGDDDDETDSSVSCRWYPNFIYYHVSLPAQL